MGAVLQFGAKKFLHWTLPLITRLLEGPFWVLFRKWEIPQNKIKKFNQSLSNEGSVSEVNMTYGLAWLGWV